MQKSYKRYRIKNTGHFREGVVALCLEFDLSTEQAELLALEIKQCLKRYNDGRAADANHFAGNHVALLQKQRGPLLKLADFGKAVEKSSQKYRNAEKLLEAGLCKWAATKFAASDTEREEKFLTLGKLGFDHAQHKNREKIFQDFGAGALVSNWLTLNAIMNEALAQTFREIEQNERAKGTSTRKGKAPLLRSPHITSDLRLIGVELPTLYERFVGRPFGINKGQSARARNVSGAKWVNICLALMGLRENSPSNIESYRTKALKAGLAVRPMLSARLKKAAAQHSK